MRSGLRAFPKTAGNGPTGFNGSINVAVFHYEGAPDANPTTDPAVNVPVSQLPLIETNLYVSVL
jgi:hypothetical protein